MIGRSIVLAACLLGIIAASSAQTAKKTESTIIGEVIDIRSYVAFGMKADTPDRKAAVLASVEAGNPLGLLERRTGKIYLVMTPAQNENASAKLKEYLGLRVYIKGIVHRKHAMQLIVMSDIGKSIK